MKFAAAALLAVVLFADATEAHRSRRNHGHRGKKGTRLSCKYVEDAADKTTGRFFVAIGQKDSDDVPNPNAIRIGGSAKNFSAADGDTLTLKSWDTAGCTGAESTVSDAIEAKERTCRKTGDTFMTARFPKSEDTSGAALSSFASFQLVGADGTALMCCNTEPPSARMLYDFILN